MQEKDVQITIQAAIEKYPGFKTRIISDNGFQFIAKDFAEYIGLSRLYHVRISVAYPQANGKIERYHRTISEECLRVTPFNDFDDAKKQMTQYIEYYNTKRLNSAIFYLAPEEVLFD